MNESDNRYPLMIVPIQAPSALDPKPASGGNLEAGGEGAGKSRRETRLHIARIDDESLPGDQERERGRS